MIFYLTPVHAIFTHTIDELIPKIILPIYTLCCEKSFFIYNPMENIKIRYCIGIIMNIFGLIGFLFYLGMIGLRVCGLEKDLNEEIQGRMIDDYRSVFNDSEDRDEDDLKQ